MGSPRVHFGSYNSNMGQIVAWRQFVHCKTSETVDKVEFVRWEGVVDNSDLSGNATIRQYNRGEWKMVINNQSVSIYHDE